ncbi:MAG: fibronectin type III domain-containing protein, partial [Alphaproteobacteria bacterium]|nr:fibronectin type III domain-containing protein [Alphaproteobacteria bacterium]
QGTPRTVPGAPQTPAATPGNGELAVTWAAPAADGGDAVATYRLRWKAADETEFADADAATVDAPALTAAITGLSNGRTYDVEIAAGNSAGFGDAATAQGTPSWNLRLESRFESLRATWDAPASGTAASYKIRWKTAGASEYSEAESATTSHTITGLQTGIIYEVQVAPVDANKIVGDFSTVARAAPVALWPPVCDRTEQVRDAIVKEVGGGKTCSRVTTQDLAGISGWFRLSSKSITALKSGDFNGLVNVTTLLLSNNDLTTLPANAFAGLEKLTDLYLSDNQLTTLPANAFAGLGELDLLRLEENELTMLPANVFAGLGKLRFLNLSGNQLTALQANLLAGLGELGWLSLNENQLTTLPANLFAGLGELLSLSLHGNQLTTLPVGAFNGLTPGRVSVSGIELPSPPAALTFTPRNRALRVQWDAAANTHYQLRWKAVGTSQYSEAALATATYTITGLQNGAEYEVRVAAFPAAPTNTDSETTVTWRSRSGRATPAAPGMPRNLRLESRAAASLHAAWDAPATGAADSYKIRWKAAGTSQYSDAAPAAAAYTITGLQNATTYEVQVAAVDGDFTGDFGAAAKGVPFTVPGAPQLLGTAAGDQTLLAMWNPPASNGGAGITTYLLRWKPKSETNYDPAKRATAGANAREHRISGLQNCGEYTLEIAAENARGPGPWASKTVAPNNWGSAALTAAEGILIARRALGVTDAESLKYGQTGEADADLMPRLNCIVDYKVIDADNDGDVDGIDGILFLRYVLGLRGAALVESYDVNAAAVEAVFQLLP